ncbi:hypothetical protein MMC25_008068 [Agyrium rufum]|nr:hypothetical protein [Agyrium rufum]
MAAEPLILEQIDLLSAQLDEYAATREVVQCHTFFLAYATDIVTKHVLSSSMGLLQDRTKALNWQRSIKSLALSVRFLNPSMGLVLDSHETMFVETRKYLANRPEKLPDIYNCDEQKKSQDRLAQEAFTIISAGGDTVVSTLDNALFYLLSDPPRLETLMQEIKTIMPQATSKPSLAALQELPYFTAIIKETLRVSALITGRLPLQCPDIMQYKEWSISAGTPISTTIHDVLLDPTIFPHPNSFFPERWLDEETGQLVTHLNPFFVPFGKGTRMCQGMDLAMAEIYMALAVVLRRFELELFDTIRERDVDFAKHCLLGCRKRGVWGSGSGCWA